MHADLLHSKSSGIFKKINLDVYIHNDFCKENSHPVIYFLRTACGLNVQYCLKKLCNL